MLDLNFKCDRCNKKGMGLFNIYSINTRGLCIYIPKKWTRVRDKDYCDSCSKELETSINDFYKRR